MTLRERLENALDTDIFFIGANTAFFFIGNKKEFVQDIPEIQEDFIKKANKTIANSKTKLENTQSRKLLSPQLEKQISDYQCQIALWKQYVTDFVPFADREIVEEYPRLLRDGTILIVEGSEIARFWLHSEYLSRNDKSKKDNNKKGN